MIFFRHSECQQQLQEKLRRERHERREKYAMGASLSNKSSNFSVLEKRYKERKTD
jgi:hypothetical protein